MFGCFGGSETRTLNRKFPMVQSLLQLEVSPIGIWVLWWRKNPYFESHIPNGSMSHAVRGVPSGVWVLWWLRNPYFESQIPNGSKSHTAKGVPQWYLGALVAQKPVL